MWIDRRPKHGDTRSSTEGSRPSVQTMRGYSKEPDVPVHFHVSFGPASIGEFTLTSLCYLCIWEFSHIFSSVFFHLRKFSPNRLVVAVVFWSGRIKRNEVTCLDHVQVNGNTLHLGSMAHEHHTDTIRISRETEIWAFQTWQSLLAVRTIHGKGYRKRLQYTTFN